MTRLSIVVPISLVVIFIILLVLFRKIQDVSLVLLNVPFALAGGFLRHNWDEFQYFSRHRIYRFVRYLYSKWSHHHFSDKAKSG